MIPSFDPILNETCWVLPFTPNWRVGIETRFTLPSETERGLTGREARRAYAGSLRLEFAFESLLTAREAASLRNALQDPEFESQPIWFPFWPGAVHPDSGYGDSFDAAQAIRWEGNEAADLVDPAAVEGPYMSSTRLIPALRGRFVEAPSVEAVTDELFVARFRLREEGPAELALQCKGDPFAQGPSLHGREFPLFPFRPQWRGRTETGTATMDFDRREIGFNRVEARALYPQFPERHLRTELSLEDGSRAADLIRFFAQQAGTSGSFWAPTWLAETRLRENLAAGATSLPVENGTLLGPNAFVALVARDGSTELHQLIASTEATIELATPLNRAYARGTTLLTTAALLRFARPNLTLQWSSTNEVSATVDLREAPYDYTDSEGEIFGTTIGALEKHCFLYRFSVAYPSLTRWWRFTSYERNLQGAGETFTAQPIEHGEIRETLNLERNEVQLRCRAFPDNPLLAFLPFRLEFPLKLEIFEGLLTADETTPHDLRRIFSGEVSRVQFDGPYLTARAVTVGNLFERKIPRVLMQPTCNYALFDGACGLAKNDWTFEGLVVSHQPNPTRLVLKTLTRASGPWVTPSAHWFAGGWIEIGSGENFESRFIADSTVYDPSGEGSIEITLATPLGRIPEVDETVTLFPGCDGKRGTCLDKFGNYDRFGGFPHLPVGNPSVVKMPDNRNMK